MTSIDSARPVAISKLYITVCMHLLTCDKRTDGYTSYRNAISSVSNCSSKRRNRTLACLTKRCFSPSKETSVLLNADNDMPDDKRSLADFSTIFVVAVAGNENDEDPNERISDLLASTFSLASFVPRDVDGDAEEKEANFVRDDSDLPSRNGVRDFRAKESRFAPANNLDETPLPHGEEDCLKNELPLPAGSSLEGRRTIAPCGVNVGATDPPQPARGSSASPGSGSGRVELGRDGEEGVPEMDSRLS